jgi:hypothetical protein
VLWTIFLVGMLGTFGLNFPVVLTAMAKTAFGGGASTYGLFNIVLGLGSAAGAVLAGVGARPRTKAIVFSAAVFGLLQAFAALAPGIAVFITLLAAMGSSTWCARRWRTLLFSFRSNRSCGGGSGWRDCRIPGRSRCRRGGRSPGNGSFMAACV